MQIPERMYEFLGAEIADLGHHHGKEGIGGDVEGDAEKDVGAPLVELAAQVSIRDVKLEESVAWRQCHLLKLARIPGTDYVTTAVGVFSYGANDFLDLIDGTSVWLSPIRPLGSVHSAEVTVFIRPFVPDADLVLMQVLEVRLSLQKPQKLVNDGTQMQLLRGEQRKLAL